MASVVKSDKFEFFWKKDSPFSQWHRCEFVENGVTYDCAEKYMMYQKALLFEDGETARMILESNDPKKQKALGRLVKNFNEEMWKSSRVNIVKEGNKLKFSQNPKLKVQLCSSHPRVLVEASPVDRIWGIGLRKEDPKALNRSTWRGQNLLGFVLMEVRDELMGRETAGSHKAPFQNKNSQRRQKTIRSGHYHSILF